MADEDSRNDGPSLELPSLGFGRRRRKKAPEPEPVDDTAPIAPEPEPLPEAVAEPEPLPEAVAEPEPLPETVAEPEPLPETVVDEAPTTTFPDPEPRPEEPARPAAPAAAAEPTPPPLYVDQVPASPDPTDEGVPIPAPAPTAPPARRARRSLSGIGGLAATVLIGLLVGVITVGLTWASLRLCEVAKGTSSCGGPGFLLLLAIMIAMVLLGSLLLRVAGVPEPGSTSFLAIGLLAVLVLLFLVDVLFAWWMIIVIPVFSVLTFALAHWVTTAFIEPADR